jgi:hypothetical protein
MNLALVAVVKNTKNVVADREIVDQNELKIINRKENE